MNQPDLQGAASLAQFATSHGSRDSTESIVQTLLAAEVGHPSSLSWYQIHHPCPYPSSYGSYVPETLKLPYSVPPPPLSIDTDDSTIRSGQSLPSTPSPSGYSSYADGLEQSEAERIASCEDKRRRNTAASARFRIKKKQRILNLERSLSDLKGRAKDLEGEAAELRRENGWLKEIVVLKGATAAQGVRNDQMKDMRALTLESRMQLDQEGTYTRERERGKIPD